MICFQITSPYWMPAETQTHGLPPEEPGREEDSPGALRWDRESYATWWGQKSGDAINGLTRENKNKTKKKAATVYQPEGRIIKKV